MRFDINQNKFISAAHKSIWHAALFLAPFYEVKKPDLAEAEATDLFEGERNLCRFMQDLYLDMYNYPELYHLPVGEYDKYMNGRERKDLPHKNDPKESSLRNEFQQPIQFYQKLLFELGVHAELDYNTFRFNIDKNVFLNILMNMRFSKIRGKKKKLLLALNRMGLEFDGKATDRMPVTNAKYPKMLLALSTLCKSSNNKYAFTNFLRCDFRGLIHGFKPQFEDTMAILPGDLKSIAIKLDQFMQELGCKVSVEPLKSIVSDSRWKVNYSLNGKSIFAFCSDINRLELFAYFNYHKNVSRMGYILKDESSELYNWFYEKIPARLCSCKNNNLVDIGGQKKRICGLMNRLDVGNPNSNDLKNIEEIIRIYFERVRGLLVS